MEKKSSAIMKQEILSQPGVCARLLDREERGLVGLLRQLKKKPPRGIVLAARGSSDHAATYARYFLEYITGIPTHLAAPSLVTLYSRKICFKDYLVIGVSQSGQGPDINAVLSLAKKQGALTLGLTNDPKSGLARASSQVLNLGAEKEEAVAATKTFTAELAGLALLGVLWSGDQALKKKLWAIPAQMSQVLAQTQGGAKSLGAKLKGLQACAVLGRGFQMGVAHEMGLKMKECAGVPALSYSVADFAHGPVALAKQGFPVFLVSAPGKLEAETAAASLDFLSRGAALHRVGLKDKNFKRLKKSARLSLDLCGEADTDEALSPLLTILPGQWFAYYNALAKGFNPAMPKGLAKVTKTR